MLRLKYDPSQSGFKTVFEPWQETAIQTLLENPEGLTSRQTWELVNHKLGKDAISRASVINFLEAMYYEGILTGEDRTGRGGHFNIYRFEMGEKGIKQFIVEKMINSLTNSFPEETRSLIENL